MFSLSLSLSLSSRRPPFSRDSSNLRKTRLNLRKRVSAIAYRFILQYYRERFGNGPALPEPFLFLPLSFTLMAELTKFLGEVDRNRPVPFAPARYIAGFV